MNFLFFFFNNLRITLRIALSTRTFLVQSQPCFPEKMNFLAFLQAAARPSVCAHVLSGDALRQCPAAQQAALSHWTWQVPSGPWHNVALWIWLSC